MAKSKYKKGTKQFFKDNFLMLSVSVVIIILIAAVFLGQEKQSTEIKLYGDDVIDMYYFHWTQCPHCIEQNKYNKKLKEMYPNLRINEYEITQAGSMDKYKVLSENYEGLDANQFPGTPLTIIGEEFNVGFGTEETTGQTIVDMIAKEQARIDASWDDATMKKTSDLEQ